jgi:ComF family protein
MPRLLDTLLPRQCLLCGLLAGINTNVCQTCKEGLPIISNPCEHCGIDMAARSATSICALCLKNAPAYHRCCALYRYESSASKLITDFKFNANFAAGKFLAEQLARKISSHYRDNLLADAMIAIPLHYTRLASRGYNQSLILAQAIGRRTKIPLINDGLYKRHATPAQTSLNSATARTQNLRGSFRVSEHIKSKGINSVIIIDDVVTTQATLNEAAKTLAANGVKKVTCFCVARAI